MNSSPRTKNDSRSIALADRLRTGAASSPTTPRRTDAEPPPLSYAQERMWLIDRLHDGTAAYNVVILYRLRGALDVAALEQAITQLHTRHEVLRTSYSDHAQIIASPVSVTLNRLDLTTAADPAEAARDRARAAAAEPRTLTDQEVVRWSLLRFGDDDHALLMESHHIAWDGWSEAIIHQELSELYSVCLSGTVPDLPELEVQYGDYAAWQRKTGFDDENLRYWTDRLAGASTMLKLPYDRPPAKTGEHAGGRCTARIPAAVAERTARLAKQEGATDFAVLLAAFGVVLARYCRQSSVVIGVPTAGRTRPELENLIGLFINTLAIRIDLDGVRSFRALTRQVATDVVEAVDHADLPLEQVAQQLHPDREPGREPLVQVLFQLHNMPAQPLRLDGLTVEREQFYPPTALLDLSLQLTRSPDGLRGGCEYRTDRFDRSTVERLFDSFAHLLDVAVTDPDQPLDDLPIMDEEARSLVARHHSGPTAPSPKAGLHELFEEQAAATPELVAVVDGERKLTYSELDDRATRIAGALAARGVGPDVPTAVMLHRSADLLAALLGVLKAGGAYVPIETDTPVARTAQLLATARCPVVLAEPELSEMVVEAGGRPLSLDDAVAGPRAARPASVEPGNLCAIYFTSGSTGNPKGVACTHGGWVNRMRWMQRRHELRPGETVLHKTTLTFDDAAVELFWPLTVGGNVAMLSPGLHRDPRALIDAAKWSRTAHLNVVPSMLELVLGTLEESDLADLSALRSVLSSGEALRPSLVARFRDRFGDRVSLDNTWGATEVSIDSTYHVCGPDDADASQSVVSLGRPFDNNQVYVLDDQWRPLPIGVPGELCIGGIGLARGYLGEPARTAGAFVPHPDRTGERLYRTGDIGRMRADGSLEFFGRDDDQVKIRGVRIELGEVESVLREHAAVVDAAVLTWQATSTDKRLAAYVVVDGDRAGPGELRRYLAERLPGYAVPGAIVTMDALPRLASGKLDRRSLPTPDPETVRETAFRTPSTPAERAIEEIWSDVLGLHHVGADDNFFAVGGHSLLATRIISRMRKAFGLHLPVSMMFERPTIAEAAEAVEEFMLAEIEKLSEEEAQRLNRT